MSEIEIKRENVLILATLGAIFGILAFLLIWMYAGIDTELIQRMRPYHGFDVIGLDTSDFQKFIPLISIILSMIMLVVAIVSGSVIPRILACIITIVIGVLLAVCGAMFGEWVLYYTIDPSLVTLGSGSRVIIFAGVLGIISGVAKLVKRV